VSLSSLVPTVLFFKQPASLNSTSLKPAWKKIDESLCHSCNHWNVEAYRGRVCKAPRILRLRTRRLSSPALHSRRFIELRRSYIQNWRARLTIGKMRPLMGIESRSFGSLRATRLYSPLYAIMRLTFGGGFKCCCLVRKSMSVVRNVWNPQMHSVVQLFVVGTRWHKNLIHCWPCIIVYQYSETNVMHFLFSLLSIKGLYMFRALLAHPQ
jgi:hypothetical protein